MQNRDSFDDPESAGIFSGIVRALDARHRFAARGPRPVLIVATIAVLAAVLYYAWPREAALQEINNAPIIRADSGPLKIEPDNPGGMDIPHRQSVVFDALGHKGERRIENLLPPAEEPLPREDLFAGLKTELPPEKLAVEPALPQPVVPEISPPVTAAKEPVKEAPAPQKTTQEKTAQEKPASPSAHATHFVQLVSIKDESAAAAEWKKLQTTYGVLASLTLRVQRADLGDRGIFYRLQGGPVAEAEAREICKAITAKKPGGCLVVK